MNKYTIRAEMRSLISGWLQTMRDYDAKYKLYQFNPIEVSFIRLTKKTLEKLLTVLDKYH